MTSHEAFQEGSVHAVKVAHGVRNVESRLQVHMQRSMAKWSHIHQGSLPIGRVQRQGEIYGDRGCAISTLCVDHGEYLAANAFLTAFTLRCREANKGLEQIGSGRGTFDELTGTGAHRIYDDLRVTEDPDGEDCRFWHFLVEQFDCAKSQSRVIRGDIDERYIGIGRADASCHRI